MNYYKLFYWLTVADSLKNIMLIFGIASAIFFLIVSVYYITDSASDEKLTKRWRMGFLISTVLCLIIYAFTPTKRDSLLIIAGGGAMEFLTTDSSAKKLPTELTNFVVTELHSMAEEAKVSIMSNNYKQEMLNRAKNMTGAELIEAMKDSSFAKVILNK